MIIRSKYVRQAVTANSTQAGLVTVGSTAGFVVGARVQVGSSDTGIDAIIVSVPSSTTLYLRDASLRGTSAPSDMSAFTVAKGSFVVQAREQLIDVIPQDLNVADAPPVRVA